MAFDFKKEYKEFHMPKNKPSILTVPAMNDTAVRGHGDPNQEGGQYKQAILCRSSANRGNTSWIAINMNLTFFVGGSSPSASN